MNRRSVWALPFATALVLVLLLATCSKSVGRTADPTALTVATTIRLSTHTPSPPTATYTRAPSPTPALPTATLTPAPTPTHTPVLTLLERLPTGRNQDFTLTLTNADLSELIAMGTKDKFDPEVYWPQAQIHPDEIVVTARLVARARALVIDAEIRGNLVLESGVPRFALNDLKTWILCYFCFEVVNGEPRLRITPGPTAPGDPPRDLLSESDVAQIGGGANWNAMAEGMVNNALYFVDPARPKRIGLEGFVITEVKQQEGLLTLTGRTQ